MTRSRVAVVLGTRPEAIKLVPVVQALEASGRFEPFVITTGQHHQAASEVLGLAGIEPTVALDVMLPGSSLDHLTARLLEQLAPTIAELRNAPAGVDAVIVQGDTTTAFVAALVAFYAGIPVTHIEAGLRTGDLRNPFPEEMNRRLVTRLAALHCAPTARARANLVAEGVPEANVVVTGNTVIDALQWAAALDVPWPDAALAALDHDRDPLLVVTAHRRESWGAGIAGIAEAVVRLARAHPRLHVVWSLHPNPAVRAAVVERAGGLPRVVLAEPLGYAVFAKLLDRATVIVTDSGGIQEEAPALGVPVLVARATTERPEAIDAGVARLVGTDPERIVAEAATLLDDPVAHAAMARSVNPFGDGRAARRVVGALAHACFGAPMPGDFVPAPALRSA